MASVFSLDCDSPLDEKAPSGNKPRYTFPSDVVLMFFEETGLADNGFYGRCPPPLSLADCKHEVKKAARRRSTRSKPRRLADEEMQKILCAAWVAALKEVDEEIPTTTTVLSMWGAKAKEPLTLQIPRGGYRPNMNVMIGMLHSMHLSNRPASVSVKFGMYS